MSWTFDPADLVGSRFSGQAARQGGWNRRSPAPGRRCASRPRRRPRTGTPPPAEVGGPESQKLTSMAMAMVLNTPVVTGKFFTRCSMCSSGWPSADAALAARSAACVAVTCAAWAGRRPGRPGRSTGTGDPRLPQAACAEASCASGTWPLMTAGRPGQVGRLAGNVIQPAVAADFPGSAWQRLGVRVPRVAEQPRRAGLLHHPARVHHGRAVRAGLHHAQVALHQATTAMPRAARSSRSSRICFSSSRRARRSRPVGDHQSGLAGQRHGDHQPLAHPARE